jgi:hypothetical protein
MQVLSTKPKTINVKFLGLYPGFLEFKTRSNTRSTTAETDTTLPKENRTSQEVIEDTCVTIRSGMASDLLEQIMRSSPSFFERLVVDLFCWGDTSSPCSSVRGSPLPGCTISTTRALQCSSRWDSILSMCKSY